MKVTDAAGQYATGTHVEQIKAQVKTDTTTDTVQANVTLPLSVTL